MAASAVNWNDCLQYAASSDVGMRRSNNQDAHSEVIAGDAQHWYDRGHLFMVADGMGAHAAGELASKLAVDNVSHLYHKHRELSPPEALFKALHETNAEIHRRGEANADFHNMGTTASVLVLLPQGALAAHVGDSRVYRLRNNKYEQLTFDHSLVWELKAAGEAAGAAPLAAGVIPKNVITRSLGPKSHVQVDMEGPFPLEVGDTFLICSDGLSGPVTDQEMATILANLTPKESVNLLVDLANLRGGPDNITVTVVRITGAQISTRMSGGEPLKIGGETTERTVPLWIWISLSVCLLAALVFFITSHVLIGIAMALLGVVIVTYGLLQRYRDDEKEVALAGGRRLGKGPYTQIEAPPATSLTEELAHMLQQLKQAANDEKWTVDWNRINEFTQRAAQAQSAKQGTAALREYGKAVSFFMQELRKERQKRKPSDSSLEIL